MVGVLRFELRPDGVRARYAANNTLHRIDRTILGDAYGIRTHGLMRDKHVH